MRAVQSNLEGVPYLVAGERGSRPDRAPSTANQPQTSHKEPEMGDVIFVVLIVATFAVLALIVKGVERLER
jgi:hypothetical protein